MTASTLEGAPSSRASAPTSVWIRGPVHDALFILNGLWLLPLVALLTLQGPQTGLWQAHDAFYLGLSAVFWIGHRFSSAWLAWFTPEYGPARRASPFRFYALPLLACVLAFGLVMPPEGVLPGSRAVRAGALAAVDFVLITWHFAAQHFGLLRLYRARSGDRSGRRLDRVVAVGIGGGLILAAECLAGTAAVADLVPGGLPNPGEHRGAFGLAGASLTLGMMGFALRRPSAASGSSAGALQASPHTLYVLQIGLMVMAAFVLRPAVFLFVWTVQHWTSATALARAYARRPIRWLVVMGLVSAVALPFFDVELHAGAASGSGQFPFMAPLLQMEWFAWGLVALGLATGLCHYILDRAVYRFSDPAVRQAAAPILRG